MVSGLDNHSRRRQWVPASDNIVYDISGGVSPSGWGHPQCSPEATTIGN